MATKPEYDVDTMTKEKQEEFKQELREHRTLMATGARSTNAGATRDMRKFSDNLDEKVR